MTAEVDPIAMKYGHGAVVVSRNSANGRGFIIHSSHNCVLLKGLSNQILDILFYGADTGNAKIIDEHFSHIGREEGRQRGAEMDVLHPKALQTEQHDNRLLLIPCDVIDDGEFIDVV